MGDPVSKAKTVKCLVWDLDNTLWDGILLEGGGVRLRPGVVEVIQELDRRGILHSIASRNEPDDALRELNRFDVAEYFLVPQIGWNNKSGSVAEIARRLNLGLDTFAFIDDQPVEREEVAFHHPEVRVYDAGDYLRLPDLPEFTPKFITEDSRLRRKMYQDDLKRQGEEERFRQSLASEAGETRDSTGNPHEAFLKSLDLRLTLSPVREDDLQRAEELTLRTNQLNSTGITFGYEELRGFIHSSKHLFLAAELEDKFGSYGKIGLMLAERTEAALHIRLLLMSCRVMNRGIGSALIVHLAKVANPSGLPLLADFVATGRNRIMYVTYKMMGFTEVSSDGDRSVLRYEGGPRVFPEYLNVAVTE